MKLRLHTYHEKSPEFDQKLELARALSGQLAVGETDPSLLRQGIAHIKEARRLARPDPSQSEVVILGALRPDYRFSPVDQMIQSAVLRDVRRKFHIGELRPVIPEPLEEVATIDTMTQVQSEATPLTENQQIYPET